MSEQNKIQNEEELWDLLSEPVAGDSKAEKPAKSEGKFMKPETVSSPKPEKKSAPAEPKPETKAAPARKLDGFFFACMAGVAAVSVAVTLIVSSMLGGSGEPAQTKDPVSGETISAATDLERENAELRAQLELQKEQINELQKDLMDFMGSEQYLATAPSSPEEGGNEVLDAQVEAYEIFTQIKAAYADFDREKLEELIPEMDMRLTYLSTDALNEYYTILEYVEQPSNG